MSRELEFEKDSMDSVDRKFWTVRIEVAEVSDGKTNRWDENDESGKTGETVRNRERDIAERVYRSNGKKNEERRQLAERWRWGNEFEVKKNFVTILKWDGSAHGRESEEMLLIAGGVTKTTTENDKSDW